MEPKLRYLAPEVLTGGAPDARSDVYTIGALAFEMATGPPPFDVPTMPELVGRVMSGDAPDPRAIASSLPEAAAAVIRRALARDPAKRPANARELLNAWPGDPIHKDGMPN